jgi:hypothetical protein
MKVQIQTLLVLEENSKKAMINLANGCFSVVELLTCDPKFKDLNPNAIGTGRTSKKAMIYLDNGKNAVVEQLVYNLKYQGSNPDTTGTKRKWQKCHDQHGLWQWCIGRTIYF